MVIDRLNLIAGRRFEHTPDNLGYVLARLKEGATVPQLFAVIDYKLEDWKETDMVKFLRPSTLFNKEKYANYREAINSGIPPGNGKQHKARIISQIETCRDDDILDDPMLGLRGCDYPTHF